MRKLVVEGLPSAGLFAGPTAWLVSTQANYALAPWTCAHGVRAVPILALPLIALSLAGGFLSWRAMSHSQGSEALTVPASEGSHASSVNSPKGGKPHRLVAVIGILMALLFALVIAVHGVAGFVFDGCER